MPLPFIKPDYDPGSFPYLDDGSQPVSRAAWMAVGVVVGCCCEESSQSPAIGPSSNPHTHSLTHSLARSRPDLPRVHRVLPGYGRSRRQRPGRLGKGRRFCRRVCGGDRLSGTLLVPPPLQAEGRRASGRGFSGYFQGRQGNGERQRAQTLEVRARGAGRTRRAVLVAGGHLQHPGREHFRLRDGGNQKRFVLLSDIEDVPEVASVGHRRPRRVCSGDDLQDVRIACSTVVCSLSLSHTRTRVVRSTGTAVPFFSATTAARTSAWACCHLPDSCSDTTWRPKSLLLPTRRPVSTT